ncbi:unnamed protein product, partial [Ectocarpus sp. 8 AP-2014]
KTQSIHNRKDPIVFHNTQLASAQNVRRKATTRGSGRSTNSNIRRAFTVYSRQSAARARALLCLLPVKKILARGERIGSKVVCDLLAPTVGRGLKKREESGAPAREEEQVRACI